MLFTNPDIPNVFPSFTWKAFGGSFSLPNLMGSELKGIHYLIDAFKIYTPTGYQTAGTMSCYPSKPLWQTSTYYNFYTSQENMAVNTYVILQWPLVDSSKGTIADYTYTAGGGVYDQFYIYTGINQLYVLLVQKLTSGFTAANGGSAQYGSISSNYQFGYLRMKHHIINNYYFYLLQMPKYKIYTASVPLTYVNTYLASTYAMSIN
jgi:hypothetical protein